MKPLRLVLFLGLLASLLSPLAAQTSAPEYQLNLGIDPEKGLISGTVRVNLPEDAAAQSQSIRLLLNLNDADNPKQFPGLSQNGPEGTSRGKATVSDLRVDGQATKVEYAKPAKSEYATFSQDALTVPLPAGARSLSFSYQAKLPRLNNPDDAAFDDVFQSRFFWFPHIVDDSYAGKINNPAFRYQADIHLEGKAAQRLDRQSGKTRWQLVRTGTRFAETAPGSWSLASDQPVFSLPLVMVRDYRLLETELPIDRANAVAPEKQILTIYCRRENEDVGRMAESVVRQSMIAYSKRYYPLDYRYISLVQGQKGAMGLGADGVVIITDGIFGGLNRTVPELLYNSFVYTVMHEIGHFWFGIGSMPDFLAENYLSEGLNEISTLDLFQEQYGKWDNTFSKSRDLANILYKYMAGTLIGDSFHSQKDYTVDATRRSAWDQALSAPVDTKIASANQSTDYDKSTFVLLMLMRLVGRDTMMDTLKAWLQDGRYHTATTEGFRASLEKSSGKDLKAFFDAYVYGTKQLDYELGGTLNEKLSADNGDHPGFHQILTVTDQGNGGLAIPSTIRLFLADGSTQEVPIDGPGNYTVDTETKVRYAGVDVDGDLLDSVRKNNFWPRQVRFYGFGSEPWLGEFGQDILGIGLTGGQGGLTSVLGGQSSSGLGVFLTDRSNYRLGLGFLGGATLEGQKTSLDYGLSLGLDLMLPLNFNLGFNVDYYALHYDSISGFSAPNTIRNAGVSFGQVWRPDVDLGYVMRTQPVSFAYSLNAGINQLSFNGSTDPFLSTGVGCSANLIGVSGTAATLDWQLHGLINSGTIEQRIGLTIDQLIPFLNHTVLGIELGGSAIFGQTVSFKAGNSVLGTALTPPAGANHFESRAKALLAIQGFNHLELGLLNLGVVQSLNFGLAYEIATAFDDAASFGANIQQAVGLEILPTVRILGDAPLTIPLGVSCNLTKAIANPGDASKWEFGFYMDLSNLAAIAAQALAY